MHIKLDEDLPNSCLNLLRSRGYQASSVAEQGLKGVKDTDLWAIIQAHQYFFITADKGFGDIRLYKPGTHQGILLLRATNEGAREYATLLASVLERVDLQSLVGTVAVASQRGLRIRRAP
jgi:predicted nuclease of predicted toxin-antitoxin system